MGVWCLVFGFWISDFFFFFKALYQKLYKFRSLRLKPSWQEKLYALMLHRLPAVFKLRILHKTRHTTSIEPETLNF